MIKQTDGIISRRVEDTIRNVARLSREGMSGVDMNIISIMLGKENPADAENPGGLRNSGDKGDTAGHVSSGGAGTVNVRQVKVS